MLATDPSGTAEVRSGARTLTVSLMLLEGPVTAGDWLVVHSGLAIERVTAAEAEDAATIRNATATEEEA